MSFVDRTPLGSLGAIIILSLAFYGCATLSVPGPGRAMDEAAEALRASLYAPVVEWRFFEGDPADAASPDFDDSGWSRGPGAFGDFDPTFPTLIIPPRTKWASSDIWIRRTFDLTSTDFVSPYLLIHHDENAEVYINGQRVLNLEHTSNFYTWYPMNHKMVSALKTGPNLVAIHCHNEHHPQYIDLGLVDVMPSKKTPTVID